MLSLDDIKSIDDSEYDVVDVWKGQVRVKSMSLRDQLEFEKDNKDRANEHDMIFSIISKSCIREDGELLFSKEDADMLYSKSPSAVMKLFNACLKVNRLHKDSLDDQAKNS